MPVNEMPAVSTHSTSCTTKPIVGVGQTIYAGSMGWRLIGWRLTLAQDKSERKMWHGSTNSTRMHDVTEISTEKGASDEQGAEGRGLDGKAQKEVRTNVHLSLSRRRYSY